MNKYEIYHLPVTHLQILDNTNKNGVVSWKQNKIYMEREQTGDKPKDFNNKKTLAHYMFCLTQFYIERCASQAFLKELKPKFAIEGDVVTFSAQSGALFGFDKGNSEQGLKSLKKVVNKIKDDFAWYYEESLAQSIPLTKLYLHIFNSNTELLKGINYVPNKETKASPLFPQLLEKQKELVDMIANDEYLMIWLKHCRKNLNKIGPHSWFTFSDDSFYEMGESPFFKQFTENRRAEAAKKKLKI